jgi:RNA polymerase sigma-70 factor (ECF subfamily)
MDSKFELKDSGIQENSSEVVDRQAEFVRLLSENHRRLIGYTCSIVGTREDAEDVVQRASIAMWKRFGDFAVGSDFMAWASTFAFYEGRNFLRSKIRSHLVFDDQLLNLIATERIVDLDRQASRIKALGKCIEKLTEPNRDLLKRFYGEGIALVELSKKLSVKPQSLYNRFCRLRKSLADCIRRRLAEGGLE